MFSRLRQRLFPIVCQHTWEDAWAFANCVEVTIPTGERRPLGWQVMQVCEKCGATNRRRLTQAEWESWRADLLDAFENDGGHIYAEDLPEVA